MAAKEKIYLLVQGDDLGNSRSANNAIWEAYTKGVLRNASLMVTCPYASEAARIVGRDKGLCIGLHCTLNSEWDKVRWGPVLPVEQVPSLVRQDGTFHATPGDWHRSGFSLEETMAELQAQLDTARSLGFEPVYADTHMRFEWVDPALRPAFEEWCRREGLMDYKRILKELPRLPDEEAGQQDPVDHLLRRLDAAESGLYSIVTHPAYDDEDTRLFGREGTPGSRIAAERDGERRMLSDPRVLEYFERNGVIPVRYDEAARLLGL